MLLRVDHSKNFAIEAYEPRTTQTLTFNEHIAPIVHENCSVCHRPGQSAPISLLSFEDLIEREEQIVEVTESRYMPPWLPVSRPHEFVGQRGLSVDQIGMIRQWVEEGCQEGAPEDLPALPRWTVHCRFRAEELPQFPLPSAGPVSRCHWPLCCQSSSSSCSPHGLSLLRRHPARFHLRYLV